MSVSFSNGAMTGPETSAAEQSRMELQAKLNGLGGINGRNLDPEAKAKKLREACEGFESIFIQKMWQEMRNAVPKTNLLTGREERFWQDMYDQELSKSMTKAGGIGLADMMYEQLSRNLVSASRSAAGSASGGAFTPGAAPLVAEGNLVDQIAPPPPAEIYESVEPQSNAAPQAGQPAAQAPYEEAAPAQASQPVMAQAPAAPAEVEPIAPVQPKAASVAAIYGAAAKETKPRRGHIHAADLGQSSGLINAQKAKRDAGDKLGSRAVRPAQTKAHKHEEQSAQDTAPAMSAGLMQNGSLTPGSAEALKAAVEMAKTGQVNNAAQGEMPNLTALVANVRAKNAAAEQLMAQAGQAEAAPAEPVTRRVRRTTNIPQRSSANNTRASKQKPGQAIRTLNVDNVGVNSKAGQGIKAWQAQKEAQAMQAEQAAATQETAAASAQPIAPLTAAQPQAAQTAAAPIPPLTAKEQGSRDNEAGISIPPLTASRASG